jgi:hypothetical protein
MIINHNNSKIGEKYSNSIFIFFPCLIEDFEVNYKIVCPITVQMYIIQN